MSISEALKVIQTEFERRFGVEPPSIYIAVHRTCKGTELSREQAEHIIRTVANEVGLKEIRHDVWKEDDHKCAWVTATKEELSFKITAFYPYTEYHQSTTEGNNARESGT